MGSIGDQWILIEWPSNVESTSWASYQICIIVGCACAGNAGNVSPRRRFQRKQLVSDPGMPHGTCVTHVSWCMSGSLTRGGGENVPGIPGACARPILGIWQEAHCHDSMVLLEWFVYFCVNIERPCWIWSSMVQTITHFRWQFFPITVKLYPDVSCNKTSDKLIQHVTPQLVSTRGAYMPLFHP